MIIVCNGGKHQDFTNLLSISTKYGLKCCYVIRDKYSALIEYLIGFNNEKRGIYNKIGK